ncbi:GTP cyclohydrolase II [Sphingomonas jejuensis]|uniref:GTP cyclohydrolase-2 n=1 Tax=Sphingomonas jejuensis TaxID=904715 RepID=A0ABX0XNS0_9SPHN|nr:GTP cyclohydrolase II [Sphingomonas jejuensis]NJC35024.1 GTP cyclohydrolase II [Sphingomonas jejuensis]
MSDARAAARAVDALRRGWPIRVGDGGAGLTVLAVESADDVRLASFAPHSLLLSGGRAATLKLANQRDAGHGDAPVLIARAPWIDLAGAVAISDPTLDLATPLKGPFEALPLVNREAATAALELARIAGLLPAFFVGEAEPAAIVTPADVSAHEAVESLAIVTRARLPVAAAEISEIVAFRRPHDAAEHVALIVGRPDGTPPLVRLHSECLTGDVLGSLRCDCGPQLSGALRAIGGAGWGILLYLRQEGRGIGLVNKLRAYRLQDQGFDTYDANVRLGFAMDARDFRVAARMLTLLGQSRIRLLTNNPAKVDALRAAGIAVQERVPLAIPANPHNHAYLDAKRDRTGHQL